ncbi:hypothetical protein ACIGKL_20550 [Pseudomonas sp. NPDC077186]|uniref:hypothetical protein n=1 Tax=Pseudomonas sp. NPDC077186 TaxID=3364421 RepID=UPI0037CBEAC9
MRYLLWLDGAAAALAGALLLTCRHWLSELQALPLALLTLIGLVNLLYAAYSLSLARRRWRPRTLIVLLVLGNLAWAAACLGLAASFVGSASPWGLAYLVGEALFVALLAGLEWRWRERLSGAA